jgi:hypothetical protein
MQLETAVFGGPPRSADNDEADSALLPADANLQHSVMDNYVEVCSALVLVHALMAALLATDTRPAQFPGSLSWIVVLVFRQSINPIACDARVSDWSDWNPDMLAAL